MSVEFDTISRVKKAGKPAKYTVKLSGDIEGIECTLILKGESEEAITENIPVFSKDLKIQLIDHNAKLNQFEPKDPEIYEETVFGIITEKKFVAVQCAECGLEMWADPDDSKPVCYACKKEKKTEKNKKAKKDWLKQTRTKQPGEGQDNNPLIILRLPDETLEEYAERKQLVEEEAFRAERKRRSAEAVKA